MLGRPEQPDQKVVEPDPHTAPMFKSCPGMAEVIIVVVRHPVTAGRRTMGGAHGLVQIDLIEPLVEFTMIAFVVHRANFRIRDSAGHHMAAQLRGGLVVFVQGLRPSFARASLLCCRMPHGFLHGLVEGAGVAVEGIVAEPEVDDSGFHPDAFIFNDLKPLDRFVCFPGLAFHIVSSLYWG